jgi:hypothetical protein
VCLVCAHSVVLAASNGGHPTFCCTTLPRHQYGIIEPADITQMIGMKSPRGSFAAHNKENR